ncbi:L-fuconolactonase [Amycolatopsis bartoniae]|uniref:Metal-dependent hydrolase n=1 Tax=Amycolatopsis bartoniae TaxID=941986 RepID=A0A8H9M8E9_9PSEU|nr:amidohydrolase family protein [Amycolatopsis bartoniae]MBB2937806.1 L-fuconolactonase [Amycolatopsis bartoniae]TVT06527.1 amidohydrolase family protein [Amycolatopsis bartoniae]GHF40843.1 metal-dependent hydrolase [Amycolatopsis bartoniae]
MNVVDTHLHLWDLTVSDYAWIPDGPLHATFTAQQARSELDSAGIDTAILVQAEDSEADTRFLLDQAAGHDWISGVVGWVRLDDPGTAERQLDRWQQHAKFRGVRHLVHDDPRDEFLALPEVRRSLAMLAERGLPFDVPDAWPRHLARVADLADAVPELTIVVDHLGKPPRDLAAYQAWRGALRQVAARPNTVAKISGLQAEPFTVEATRPAVHDALEAFGPERLMYGGDWPMTVLYGGYARSWEILSALIGELSETEQARVLAGTADAVYGTPERVT